MTSEITHQKSIIESLTQVLRSSPKCNLNILHLARHVLIQSMLKTDYGKAFVYNHLEILTELICVELDLELFVKVCYFKHALSYYHSAIDLEYISKSKLLLAALDILPAISFWDMYVIAVICLKHGWWNISTCFLQTLSSQKNLSDRASEWLLFLKGYSEEEDALISLKNGEYDCETTIETLEFMIESELPSNLPLFHSNLLSARRFLLVVCLTLLKSYLSEIEIEDLVVKLALCIRNLRDISRTWSEMGYHNIKEACESFILVLLAGRTLEQFEKELEPYPEVISVIETLDFKVFDFLFSFTWRLPDQFFQDLPVAEKKRVSNSFVNGNGNHTLYCSHKS